LIVIIERIAGSKFSIFCDNLRGDGLLDSNAIFQVLISEIRLTIPELVGHPIVRNDAMADLGVNSMERGEILIATLETINLEIPMTQLHGPSNLGELADLIHAKSAQQ
jgi:polyketide biosynthesis acyl carrier protein